MHTLKAAERNPIALRGVTWMESLRLLVYSFSVPKPELTKAITDRLQGVRIEYVSGAAGLPSPAALQGSDVALCLVDASADAGPFLEFVQTLRSNFPYV